MSEIHCLTLLTIYYVTHDSNWTGGGVLLICFKRDTTHYLWTFPAETHKRSRIKASQTSSNDLKLSQTEHTCKLFPWAISQAMMMILPLSYQQVISLLLSILIRFFFFFFFAISGRCRSRVVYHSQDYARQIFTAWTLTRPTHLY